MEIVKMLGDRRVDVIDMPVPKLSPGEAPVRVCASAIYGSERHGYLHGAPINYGHEICGVVEEVCETKHLRPGDHVGGAQAHHQYLSPLGGASRL